GLGYIGQVIAGVLSNKKIKVIGIETNPDIVNKINQGEAAVHEPHLHELIQSGARSGNLIATNDYSRIPESDIIIITVNTPIDQEYKPDLKNFVDAITSLSKALRKGQVIILKSTIPPLTTVQNVIPILEQNSHLKANQDFWIGFSPERLAEGKAIEEFENYPIVVGGYGTDSSDIISYFWKSILGVETITMPSPTEAELVKLADNLWIDLNIALANELAILSDKLQIDVSKVIMGANTLPKGKGKVNILFPSVGVGGSCLTKDPWFVHEFGKKLELDLKIPPISRTINSSMPYYTFHLLEKNLKSIGKDLKSSKICILGLSFKNNTGDLRETPVKYIVDKLLESHCNFTLYDPWVNRTEAEKMFNKKLESSIEGAAQDSDCVMVLCGHDEFVKYPKSKLKEITKEKCIFLDGRNSFERKEIEKTGFVYQGIGK
ncbi:MAG: nucleotide sugar dehydrogenase, partial [Nitrosopumilaceae archaeon]